MDLSDGDRISMIRLAVLIQYTRVTDGQTDGIGVAYTRYSIMLSRVKTARAIHMYHADASAWKLIISRT